jgi:diguanylate cyclase (GGDEF)-like protein
VAEAAVVRAAQMLKADVVQISIDGDGEGLAARTFAGDSSGLSADAEQDDTRLTMYVAPLEGPRGRIGVLRIGFNGSVTLTKREQQVLKTFAHAVSTTLQNARLYAEMREHAQAKAFEAEHDSLTGLGNRALLHDRASMVLEAAALDGTQVALLIIDLDHFKEINDTLGHAAGDLYLQQVGQRITSALPHADAICRLGGDEYAVLLGGLYAADAADTVAAGLLEVLAEPVTFDGLRLSIEGSVGVACYPEDASSFDELLQRADVALYQAKDSRGSFSHYRAERDVSSLQRLALAAELRSALVRDELVVHFQPQYDLQSGAICGAEALVRWQHPQRGLLQPGDFVAAVEHSGLIRDFTLAVLDKSVSECAAWARHGVHLNVAVNLSARNLLDRQLPLDVADVLTKHGLPGERLILEITETTMMSELDVVESVLGQLRGIGVQLSVDDFGTGYSSLAFLQRVQVNEVMIDRSFVVGVAGSDNDRALVRATVQLAHSLGARAVGEGVETREQLDALRLLGCDFAQGYHLARPMPAEALRTLIGVENQGMAAVAGGPLPAPRPEHEVRHLRAVAETGTAATA